MTTSVVIGSVTLEASSTAPYGLTEDGLGRPDVAWEKHYAEARDYEGAILTDARRVQASVTFEVLVRGTSTTQVESRLDALVAAVSSFAYSVVVTVDGDVTTYAADPADVAFGGYDSGMVAGFFRSAVLTIPVYPIPS